MSAGRAVAVALLGLTVVGSLAASGGYAWYLRSAIYRNRCAHILSTALGLPSDIERIVPRSWSTREFGPVTVWLPGRRDRALFCDRALVICTPRPDDPDAYEIELTGGTCEISTRTWLREDYRRVVASGLKPGFDPLGPQRVRFSGMDIRFQRDRFRGWLEDAAGVIEFPTDYAGWAAAHCSAINGYVTEQPIALTAHFSPELGGIRIDELTLRVPDLPVGVLGLSDLIGVGLRSGTFSGELLYREVGISHRTSLRGKCQNISLAECTAGLTPRPWRGTGPEIELKELTLEDGWPQRLRFGGVLTGVVLGDLLAPWGLGDVGGEMVLRVRDADLSPRGIERLIASGRCTNLSLEALTRALGSGQMTGIARLIILDLTIEQNRLRSLEAEFRIDERDQPDWVEGKLLTELVRRTLGFELPPILPQRIEYTRLGFRIEVRDEELYVFGSHGPGEKTILTVRVMGQEIPLLPEPEQSFDLSGWLDLLRVQASAWMQERLATLRAAGTWEAISAWPAWPEADHGSPPPETTTHPSPIREGP